MSPGCHFHTGSHERLARFAGLPVRAVIGFGFLMHGLAKWSRGPEAFATVLHSLGMPASQQLAWTTIGIEVAGGVAFLLGAFISLMSVPAIIVLIAAIATVHLPYGFSSIKLVGISNGRAQFGPPGYECALLYLAGIVTLALTGPTPWSVDAWRGRASRKKGTQVLTQGL